MIDETLRDLDASEPVPTAPMTSATVVELAWALRGMLGSDPDRFLGSRRLM